MKNKYLYKLGCFVLGGTLLLSTPAAAYAAQQEMQTETASEKGETDAETDAETEKKLPQLETQAPDTAAEPLETETQTDSAETGSAADEMPDIGEAPGEQSGKPGGSSDALQLPDDGKDSDLSENVKEDGDAVNEIEDEGNTIQKPDGEETQTDHSDAAAGYTSNIIAGNDVYLGTLSTEYGLTFADKFETVMDGIEEDYRAFLDDPEDFTAENWQDVLAVYVMKQGTDGGGINLDAKCRDELEKIFFMMNLRSNSAMLRKLEAEQSGEADAAANADMRADGTEEAGADEENVPKDGETAGAVRTNRRASGVDPETENETEADSDKAVSAGEKEASGQSEKGSGTEKEYYALTVQDYITLYGVEDEEKELLEKYTSTECRQLCAIITAAKGFVRGEAGEGVSEERIAIVSAACSLIGKVGYFWGGKSYAMGWDDRWGDPMTVSASGSKSSGTVRSYGLDCSGFVAWSYYNGLNGKDAGIGNHTTTQWNATEMVDSQDAKPGDLVFYRPGSAGDDNHVGIVIGVNDNGSLLVAHCSSGQNGVVTGEAWSAGFQYVRSPIGLED